MSNVKIGDIAGGTQNTNETFNNDPTHKKLHSEVERDDAGLLHNLSIDLNRQVEAAIFIERSLMLLSRSWVHNMQLCRYCTLNPGAAGNFV